MTTTKGTQIIMIIKNMMSGAHYDDDDDEKENNMMTKKQNNLHFQSWRESQTQTASIQCKQLVSAPEPEDERDDDDQHKSIRGSFILLISSEILRPHTPPITIFSDQEILD